MKNNNVLGKVAAKPVVQGCLYCCSFCDMFRNLRQQPIFAKLWKTGCVICCKTLPMTWLNTMCNPARYQQQLSGNW